MLFSKLFKLFKKEQKHCFADEDGMIHAGCASMSSCEKCLSYRHKNTKKK